MLSTCLLLITSKKVKHIKSHLLTININLLKQLNINHMFDKKPNDPDDENEHFKQPHIAIE